MNVKRIVFIRSTFKNPYYKYSVQVCVVRYTQRKTINRVNKREKNWARQALQLQCFDVFPHTKLTLLKHWAIVAMFLEMRSWMFYWLHWSMLGSRCRFSLFSVFVMNCRTQFFLYLLAVSYLNVTRLFSAL